MEIISELQELSINSESIGDEENIKKRGLRGPFIVTRIGNELVTYTDFNRLIAAKEMGKELVPCVIISNELMNKRINRLNRYRRYNKLKTI